MIHWVALLACLFCALLVSGCGTEETASPADEAKPAAAQAEAAPATGGRQDGASYTMQDIHHLKNTKIFAKGALEHIFDGTINKKGKATGYHYSMIEDSKGKILEGTRSKEDKNGIFTAKVEVSGVKKNGFSSFYPETWSPQDVVDAINRAYQDAMKDPDNPHGSLWIGHDGKLEIDMYLDDHKKIVTAYPIFHGE